jgi:hypothetical protein
MGSLRRLRPFTVTANVDGRFRAEPLLDPLLVCAHSPDGKLGGFVEIGDGAPEVTIAVGPTATATGRLLDETGEPARNVKLNWGRRIYLDDDMKISERARECSTSRQIAGVRVKCVE